jgi:hypothetical protein
MSSLRIDRFRLKSPIQELAIKFHRRDPGGVRLALSGLSETGTEVGFRGISRMIERMARYSPEVLWQMHLDR